MASSHSYEIRSILPSSPDKTWAYTRSCSPSKAPPHINSIFAVSMGILTRCFFVLPLDGGLSGKPFHPPEWLTGPAESICRSRSHDRKFWRRFCRSRPNKPWHFQYTVFSSWGGRSFPRRLRTLTSRFLKIRWMWTSPDSSARLPAFMTSMVW